MPAIATSATSLRTARFSRQTSTRRRQYPVWNLLKTLNAEGKLTPVQAVLCAPTMPEEELYDLQADPDEVANLANSKDYHAVLVRLRAALERWIEDTRDQGRELEPPEVARRMGLTKPESKNPNIGYAPGNKPKD